MGYLGDNGKVIRGFRPYQDIHNLSFSDLNKKIKKMESSHYLYNSTFKGMWKIVKENPFTEEVLDILLEEGWSVVIEDIKRNQCHYKSKLVKLRSKLIDHSESYDSYLRDIILMHELNHSWYHRFSYYGEPCLHDAMVSRHDYEGMLINEYLSRVNRADYRILRKAVRGFGLKPQIYDASSKLAFGDDSDAEVSPVAVESRGQLQVIIMDGFDKHLEGPLFRDN